MGVSREKDVRIYVIGHKLFEMPVKDTLYTPMLVGPGCNSITSDYIGDNTGDNISEKNNRYNELTGLYWIWKNTNHEIVGLCHYRRYFTTPIGKIMNATIGIMPKLIDEKYILDSLKKHDIILHNKTYFSNGNINQLTLKPGDNDTCWKLHPRMVEIAAEVFSDMYPEHVDIYKNVMNAKNAHLLNVMIARKELVDEYCEWMFPYLFEVEKRIDMEFQDEELPRVTGLIAERTMDAWIRIKKLKVKECFTVNTERIDRNWIAG